jgi:hypothetical protein
VPYFYTGQYDLSMAHSGFVEPDECERAMFRGDAGKRESIAFWLDGWPDACRHERDHLGRERRGSVTGEDREAGRRGALADPSPPLE